MITTFYIIFEDDIKRACLPISWDLPLETFIAIILIAILIEMSERGEVEGRVQMGQLGRLGQREGGMRGVGRR